MTEMTDLQQALTALDADHDKLGTWLIKNAHWCGFAQKMLHVLGKGQTLSEKQLAALASIRAKQAAPKPKPESVDLTAVRAMFEAALANGLKRPQFRAAGIHLSLAPLSGKNAGAIYVKKAGAYCGKIDDTTFRPTKDGADLAPVLQEIAADPKEAAVKYGKETGTCACCGRDLSDPVSVAAGIGPICATKWGL